MKTPSINSMYVSKRIISITDDPYLIGLYTDNIVITIMLVRLAERTNLMSLRSIFYIL